MRFYSFNPKGHLLFTRRTWEKLKRAITEGKGEAEVSFDLELSTIRVKLEGSTVKLPAGALNFHALPEIKPGEVWILEGNLLRKACCFANGKFYKLVDVGQGAPTLEISGIHMHRVKDVDPWRDAADKVGKAGVRDGTRVLDVGTGLGYTAIWSMKRGGEVLTIEVDRNVLEMAEENPWSRELCSANISIVLGDAAEVVYQLDEEAFDVILNDPPRFALAGELYSLGFYRQLFRLLKPRGRLYHYVGEPGRSRRKRVLSGVIRRLREVGFERCAVGKGWVLVRKPKAFI